MIPNEAIEIMCRRCINYEVCSGTGCEPKRALKKNFTLTYESANIDKVILDIQDKLIRNKLTIRATSEADLIITDERTGEERVYKDLGYPI